MARGPISRTRWTWVVAGALAAAGASMAGTTSAATQAPSPEGDGVNQLTLGDWSGIGTASGLSSGKQGGTQLLWVAGFENRFRFTVTEEAVSGEFTLTSSGMYGNEQMAMTLTGAGGPTFGANWNIDPPAQGTVSGDRTNLQFTAGAVTTSGVVELPDGGTFPVSGQPSTATINNTITHLECDSAQGNWEVSLIQQIENEGWTTNWSGAWAAFPVPDPDQATEAEELIEGLDELFEDFGDFNVTASTGLDPDAQYDPTNIDRPQMMDLASRATKMANRIHNLSPCDADQIGSETIREWQTALARGVGDLVIAAADALAALGDTVLLDYANLNALIVAADSTGAYGAGSPVNQGEAFQVEDSLVYLTGRSVEQHLDHAAGEVPGCQDSACRTDHYNWAAGGVASAVTHGWSITVSGQTYSPTDAPQLVATPPGES